MIYTIGYYIAVIGLVIMMFGFKSLPELLVDFIEKYISRAILILNH